VCAAAVREMKSVFSDVECVLLCVRVCVRQLFEK
jgi:hypothetical protein